MAIGATVFSRVTVVAPRTRIDVALPADVAVADLLPMLLDMAREATPDGGARHGGWCLARLGENPLDPGRTLASLGVVDGDLLQLRRRSENPPPPLYDDVVDAIAEANPDGFTVWNTRISRRFGHTAAVLALITAAAAVLYAGPISGGTLRLFAAIAAGLAAVIAVAVGAAVARSYRMTDTGVLIAAAGGLPMAFVCGLYVVPTRLVSADMPLSTLGPANVLLACVLVLVVAASSLMIIGAGVVPFIAAATAAALGALVSGVAIVIDAPPYALAAATAAVALGALSVLPRLTIQLAQLPLPQVPGSAEDLKEDAGFPDFEAIQKRAGLAHQYMTGLVIGCGAAAAIGAVIGATSPTLWGPLEAAVVAAVLLLRGRSYANSSQAIALVVSGIVTAAGLCVGWIAESSPLGRLLWVSGALIVVAVGALLVGVVFPGRRFSPVLRRSVDILEAVLIAAVLPLAFGAMNLYSIARHVHIGG